jgi:hypothetical protein
LNAVVLDMLSVLLCGYEEASDDEYLGVLEMYGYVYVCIAAVAVAVSNW